MNRLTSIIIVATIFIAGCAQPEASPTDPGEEERESGPFPEGSGQLRLTVPLSNGTVMERDLNAFNITLQVQDCVRHGYGLRHYENEHPQTPEAYPPVSEDMTSGSYYVFVNLLECASLLLENATLDGHFTFAWTGLAVMPDEAVRLNDYGDTWMYEVFTDSEALHEVLRAAGIPSILAQFIYKDNDTGSRTFTMGVEGEVWYETALSAQEMEEWGESNYTRRNHQTFGGEPRWVDYNRTGPCCGSGPIWIVGELPATFTAHAGVLQEVMGTAGTERAHFWTWSSEGNLTFGPSS